MKTAKVSITKVKETYDDGSMLAIVKEIEVVNSPRFKLKQATTSIIYKNNEWVDGPQLPQYSELDLLDCNLNLETMLSPFRYEYIDEENQLREMVIYVPNNYVEYIPGSGLLGKRVN